MAIQDAVFTRIGTDRVIAYAFELAASARRAHLRATKSNGIIHTMPFWDELFADVREQYPDAAEQVLIDALAALLVLDPARFDVIVASNLFGDILSDLAAAVAGSIGMAPRQPEPGARVPLCSSRSTAPRPTSPAGASPTRSARLVGGDDARPSRRAGGGGRVMRAIGRTLADPGTRTATSAAPRRPPR